MDDFARFCIGWGILGGLPFVIFGARVPGCLGTIEFTAIAASVALMLVFGVGHFALKGFKCSREHCGGDHPTSLKSGAFE